MKFNGQARSIALDSPAIVDAALGLSPSVRADVEELVRVAGRAGALTEQLLTLARRQRRQPRS